MTWPVLTSLRPVSFSLCILNTICPAAVQEYFCVCLYQLINTFRVLPNLSRNNAFYESRLRYSASVSAMLELYGCSLYNEGFYLWQGSLGAQDLLDLLCTVRNFTGWLGSYHITRILCLALIHVSLVSLSSALKTCFWCSMAWCWPDAPQCALPDSDKRKR